MRNSHSFTHVKNKFRQKCFYLNVNYNAEIAINVNLYLKVETYVFNPLLNPAAYNSTW